MMTGISARDDPAICTGIFAPPCSWKNCRAGVISCMLILLINRYGSRKLFQIFIKLNRIVVAIAGPESGMNILVRTVPCPAPSIEAASVKSPGIELKNSVRSMR